MEVNDIIMYGRNTGKKRRKNNDLWKTFEREVAGFFHTSRTPMSGSLATTTSSDTLHKTLFIECKWRSNYPIVRNYYSNSKGNITEIMSPKNLTEPLWIMDKSMFHDFIEEVSLVYDSEGKESYILPMRYRDRVVEKRAVGAASLMRNTVPKADEEYKVPILALKQGKTRSWLIGFMPKDLRRIKKQMQWI